MAAATSSFLRVLSVNKPVHGGARTVAVYCDEIRTMEKAKRTLASASLDTTADYMIVNKINQVFILTEGAVKEIPRLHTLYAVVHEWLANQQVEA